MKTTTILLILATISFNAVSQNDNLQFKLDSIVEEANLLYNYEKSVWNSSDLLMSDEKLKENYGGYITYHSNDTIFVTFTDKDQINRIAQYIFIDKDLDSPIKTNFEVSELNKVEKEYSEMKNKILNQLSDSKYEVRIPRDFNPNFVLLKEQEGFKLYILMGTSESGVIPFGNDYLFNTDKKGNIEKWRKFHSIMIPTYSEGPNGEKVVSTFHSHLKSTPYITATDICTFRLYGELCGMKEFTVLCTATEKYYKYSIDTNKIEITKP